MRKNATKIAAMMLSLALTVTSVNVPTTASAANKVKLASKATLYVGGTSDAKASVKKTKTLKAKVNGKKVKATFTSNKPKVAKVNKTTGKVTAKKAGTATITAKYNGKKAKCKITVKQLVTNVVSSESVVDVKVGDRFNLASMISVVPSNASSQELSFKSDDSLIVAVNKDGTIVKGVKEGQAAITVKAKDGSNKTARVVVNVTPAESATETPTPENPTETTNPTETATPSGDPAKIVAEVINPVSDELPETVMVGTNAEIKVQVLDENGNPMKNKPVVLNASTVIDKVTNYPNHVPGAIDRSNQYTNLTDIVLTTNEDGYAIFVFGVPYTVDTSDNNRAVDALNVNFASTHKLTFKVADDSGAKLDTEKVYVRFAAFNASAIGGVDVHSRKKNATTKADEGWAAATNIINSGTDDSNVITTNNRNGVPTDYVRTQQVSDADRDHAVEFSTDWKELFVVTGLEAEDTSTEPAEFTVTREPHEFYRDYKTYAQESNTAFATVITEEKADNLQYATVNFGDLTLSKYSRFTVQAYIVSNKDDPTGQNTTRKKITLPAAESLISGEKVSKDFSVQIPIYGEPGWLYVMATIESKGQVNLDKNDGFSVKSITGVRRGETVASAPAGFKADILENLKVEWAIDTDAGYTISSELPAGNVRTALSNNPDYADCKFEYRMPAFPRTGNAIITVINKENKEIAYYAVPVVNDVTTPDHTAANPEYTNVNRIDDDADLMYQISEQEAKYINKTDKLEYSQDGSVFTVNSTETGVTHVIGTISCENSNIKIDPTNAKIYSSIHWNPLPKKVDTPQTPTVTNGMGAALAGQKIVLKAQLTDVNGNPVTTSGVSVGFYDGSINKDADPSAQITTALSDTVGSKGVSVIKADDKTDASGQAELILFSGKDAEALDIYARLADEAGNNYDLKYYVGPNNVEVTDNYIDLYWVDANLMFESDANYTNRTIKTDITTPNRDTAEPGSAVTIQPTVGENWAYEVRAYGYVGFTFGGKLAALGKTGANIEISGLTIHTKEGSDSKGTVTNAGNGKAEVTWNKIDDTYLVNTLDAASVPNDNNVTITVDGQVVPYVGSDMTSLSKKLTLTVDWQESVPTAQVIVPTGLYADYGWADVKVYVLVQDANGNPIAGKDVTLKVTGAGATTLGPDTTTSTGIATFTLTSPGAAGTSALTATVDGMSTIATGSVTWVDTPTQVFQITKVAYADKKLTLTFNNDISEGSVKNVKGDVVKSLFKVYYGQNGNSEDIEQVITAAEVSGNKIVLTLGELAGVDKDTPFKVQIVTAAGSEVTDADQTVAQIGYRLVSVDAQELSNNEIQFKTGDTEPDATTPTITPVS